MSLPKGINFQSVKPRGFYQEWRDYFITPVQTYTNQFSVYDIVRIQFNLQGWYIDPYESYIEAEVRLANETPLDFTNSQSIVNSPVQFLMMDGPSTSLINDFRFEVNSKEIERIREYDQVGNLLTDLCMYPEAVDQKDYEGYYSVKGEKTLSEISNLYQQTASTGSTYASTTTTGFIQRCVNDNIIPPQATLIGTRAANVNNDPYSSFWNAGSYAPLDIAANNQPMNYIQPSMLTSEEMLPYTATTKTYLSPHQMLFQEADGKVQGTGPLGAVYNYEQFLGQLTAGNTNFGISSADYVPFSSNTYNTSGYIPCKKSPKLGQVDGHNIFLTNMPTSKIVNGNFVDQVYSQSATTQNSRTYMQIPLLSGVMGVLIPHERWQLIPSSSLGQVNMEFRFNPNAFFSHDGSNPNWIVTKFQLRLRMYRFDQTVMSQLASQVSSGIQMHSQVFSMGPIYNIQANTSVTNNWQLNNGIPSIKQLFFWFLSNDYETAWHARKNFKVCQNIMSMQLKVGSTYMPQNPILGHAGNIVMNQFIQQDNSVYLSELHQALNLLFDCKKHININKVNFAINARPYDVTLNKMFGATLGNGYLTSFKQSMLKSLGYTMWNEMRCRGKAVYAFNLEMDKRNADVMSGLDTTKVRPIELILKNDDGNYYARQSTMYVMFLSDFLVTFNGTETTTEGAG